MTLILVGGLPGVFLFGIGLAVGALSLMLGLSGVIWGAVHSGVNRGRLQRLEDERALLLRQADGLAPLVLPRLVTLATF